MQNKFYQWLTESEAVFYAQDKEKIIQGIIVQVDDRNNIVVLALKNNDGDPYLVKVYDPQNAIVTTK